MSLYRLVFSAVVAGVLCASALGQIPLPPARSGAPRRPRPRQEPCWQVAGISKSAIQQVRAIRQQARQEIEAVCANSSLSLQQKHQQIREIREKEKQQTDALISPAQRQELRACREQRGRGGRVGGGGGGRGAGPCGTMPGAKEPEPESDRED